MPIFSSTYINKVDKKGRVSVPAAFRSELPDDNPAISILPSLVCKAIEGFDRQYLSNINDQIDNFDIMTNAGKRQSPAAKIISRSITITIDSDGRIVLPQAFLKHAGIGDKAVFVGLGSSFRIWGPEAHDEAVMQDEGA